MKLPNKVKILAVGDIVGKGARNAFINFIPTLKEKYDYDILVVNAENTTHGCGLSYKHYLAYVNAGVDVLTMGNHTFDNKEIFDYIDKASNLIIPGNINNLDEKFTSHKEKVIEFNGKKIKFVNILGDFNTGNFDKTHPFIYEKKMFEEDNESIYVIDFHAELTAEKNAFGYEVDGKASMVYGTHTHVQTSDERILPKGTAFISDVGMCGSKDSVIGYDYESYVKRMWEQTPSTISSRLPMMINAILVNIDLDSKKAVSIKRINEEM